jgi:hypothetical protein
VTTDVNSVTDEHGDSVNVVICRADPTNATIGIYTVGAHSTALWLHPDDAEVFTAEPPTKR